MGSALANARAVRHLRARPAPAHLCIRCVKNQGTRGSGEEPVIAASISDHLLQRRGVKIPGSRNAGTSARLPAK